MSFLKSYNILASLGFLDSFNPKQLICEVIVTRLSNEKLMNSERTKTLETTSLKQHYYSKSCICKDRETRVQISTTIINKKAIKKNSVKKKKKNLMILMLKKKNEQGNVVESNEQDGKAFVCVLAISCESNIWYIYSITSSHLLHCKDWFKTYENILPIKIYMGE
jgi:hypothetical protein